MSNNPGITFTYIIKRQASGKYIALNHNYEPPGTIETAVTDHNDYPGLDIRLTSNDAKKISCHGDRDTETIYLYSDGSPPWSNARNWMSYADRLCMLLDLAGEDLDKQVRDAILWRRPT